MPNLTRAEAEARAAMLDVIAQSVDLDVTGGPDTFGSTTEIRFRCTEPGGSTFLDLVAPAVHSVTLNGQPLDPAEVVNGDRIDLPALAADNVVTVTADCAYSHTGEGLHRFVDPVDGEIYLYSQAALNDAQRIFACFDQPDLKTRFTIGVTAPAHWTVLSNSAGRETATGRWDFDATAPLSTYLAAVVAGPYHSVRDQHGDIPLGVHCRRSLAEHFNPDELLTYTRQAFDFYHRQFGIPYPFGKYDQVWVPEFNLGAMENAGCVTFRDEYIFRSKATDAQHELLATVIAHEMAHMWFGDLVTMRWWDDLWLNESFADFMGYLVAAEATRFTSAWTTFCSSRKVWGYRADQLPSTHPISSAAPDTDTALLNFDGISYAKGASVLKQLVAWVGREQFFAGVQDYFRAHAYGNTALTDLLGALEESSGRDLRDWAAQWLQTTGVNTLRPEVVTGEDGRYESVAVTQRATGEAPTLRSHRMAIGLYDRSGERLVRRDRIEVDVTGRSMPVPLLSGVPAADLLLLNDDDLTFAKIRFDARSLDTVLGGLGRLEDSLARALCWAAAWDMVLDGELAAGAYLDLVVRAVGAETEIGVVEDALRQAVTAAEVYGEPARRAARLGRLAGHCLTLLRGAAAASDRQLAFARAFARAAQPDQAELLQQWLAGSDVPEGLAMDPELRWHFLTRLCALGLAGEAEIGAEHRRDDTATGATMAEAARASLPTTEAKAAAWSALFDGDTLSNRVVEAVAGAFWRPEQLDVVRPYAQSYLERMPALWGSRTPGTAVTLATRLFPRPLVEDETLQRVDDLLAADTVAPPIRRVLVEQRAEVARALRARACDAAAEAG